MIILQAYTFMFKLLEPNVGDRLSAKDALNDEVCPLLVQSLCVLIPRLILVARASKESSEGEWTRPNVAGPLMQKAYGRLRMVYVNSEVRANIYIYI